MSKERKTITVQEVAEAKRRGLNFILENLEAKGSAVIRGKDGKVKGKVKLGDINVTGKSD
jgi:hypothetical protein